MAKDQNLEDLGVDLVFRLTAQNRKNAEQFNITVERMTGEVEDLGKESDKTRKKLDKIGSSVDKSGKSAKQGSSFFSGLTSQIKGMINPTTIAVTAVTAIAGAIYKLGQRGGEVNSIRFAFENLIAPVLQSGETIDDFVAKLRAGAADTISEVELMRNANLALAGTRGELRETFANSLPDLLEIARVQAAATGQSVDHLFESLVVGIKRGSPLLIDNTGLTLNMTEAYQDYADSIGVSVEALTDQQKQIAIINATVTAGQQAIEDAGGLALSAADRVAQAQALIQNSVDNVASGMEQVLNGFLMVINPILQQVERLSESVGAVLNEIGNRFVNFINFFSENWGQAAINARKGGEAMASSVNPVVQAFYDFTQQASEAVSNFLSWYIDAAANFYRGAVALASAIGNGWLTGANEFIFPAIINIATFIADFLTGFSPAKRGPLSKIDQGAAALAGTWAGSFAQGLLPNTERTVKEVDDQLGSIGELSADQVEQRLNQLDLAIRPFNEKLMLAEANFKRIAEPANAAMDLIDRQINRATEGLLQGDEAAANLIRQQQTLKASIQEQIALREDELATAKIQQTLAQSAILQERTRLLVQQGRVGKVKEEVKAEKERTKAIKESSTAATKARTGGSGGAPSSEAEALSIPDTGTQDQMGRGMGEQVNPLAALDQVIGFGMDLGADFMSGLNAGGELDEFQSNVGLLGEQFDRIGESNPVQAITGAFSDLATEMGDIVGDAVAWFTDPNQEGGLANIVTRINTEGTAAVFGDVTESIGNWITTNIVDPIQTRLQNLITVGADGNIYSYFETLVNNLPSNMMSMGQTLLSNITTWFNDNLITPVSDQMRSFFGFGDGQEGIDNFFTPFIGLPDNIEAAVGSLMLPIDNLIQPIWDWMNGEGEEGGLPALIDGIIGVFATLPRGIFDALYNIGATFYAVMVAPLQSIIDASVDVLNDWLTAVTDNDFVNFFRTQFPNVFGGLPEGVAIQSPQIPMPAFNPVFPVATQQKTGGLTTGPGLLQFHEGEMGMLMSGAGLATFNRQFVDAMNMMSNMILTDGGMGIGVPQPQNITNNSSIDNSLTVNGANMGQMSPEEFANRLAIQRAFA